MDIEHAKNVTAALTTDEKLSLSGVSLSLVSQQISKKKIYSVDLDAQSYYSAPNLLAVGCTFDNELLYFLGKESAVSAYERKKAVGGIINLGVIRNPMGDGAQRMLSEDPAVVKSLAESFINGAGERVFADGILGGENGFEDRYIDPRTLREIYLFPFMSLGERLGGVVLDGGALNGVLCSENKSLINFIKEHIPANAPVLAREGTVRNPVVSAQAGAALAIGQNKEGRAKLKKAVENGSLHEGTITSSLGRFVAFVESAVKSAKNPPPAYIREYNAYEKLAKECIVLLKNDDGVLPLSGSGKINICGDGEVAHKLAAAMGEKAQKERAEDAQNIVCVSDFEKGSKALEKVQEGDILVIFSPRPVEIGAAQKAKGIIFVPTAVKEKLAEEKLPILKKLAEETFPILKKIIFGEINPSGHLSVTWAQSASCYPCEKNALAKKRGAYCFESVLGGYRYFSSFDKKLLFPFGHGLSYSDFSVSKADADMDGERVQISFSVKNESKLDGECVVFAFSESDSKEVFGLKKRLVGFTRVKLAAGQSSPACIQAPTTVLKVYSQSLKKFEFCGGKQTITLGFSAEDTRVKTDLKIPKTKEELRIPSAKEVPSYYSSGDFNPSGVEIERVTGIPLVAKPPQYFEYVCGGEPSEKTVSKAAKRIEKLSKVSASSADLRRLPQKVLEDVVNSD